VTEDFTHTRGSLPASGRLSHRVRLAGFLSVLVLAGFAILEPVPLVHAQEETAKKTKSLVDNLKAGGFIGFVIIGCSMVGVSLCVMYAIQIRRDELVPPELLGQVEQLFEDEEYEEAMHVLEANPSFLSSILVAGLARMDEGYEEMEKAMQETGEVETMKLNHKVGYISLIAAITPMLGLFGTVSGMISTFNVIALAEVQPKPSDLAGGISQALVTTYEGLVVAIPMLIVFNIFRNRVMSVVAEVGGITEELMGRFRTAGGEG